MFTYVLQNFALKFKWKKKMNAHTMRVKWIWMMREIGNFYQNANERKMGTCGRFDRMKAPNDRKFSSYFAKFFENKKKKRAENARKSQKQKAKRKRFFCRSVPCIFLVFECCCYCWYWSTINSIASNRLTHWIAAN